jgi:hypothetical protein
MARKKRAFLSDNSSEDESDENDYEEEELGDADAQAERELHEDPYQQRKRRRLDNRGNEDTTYGMFGEDVVEGPIYRRAAPRRKAK